MGFNTPRRRRGTVEDDRCRPVNVRSMEARDQSSGGSIEHAAQRAVAVQRNVLAGTFLVVMMAVVAEKACRQPFRAEDHGPAVIQAAGHVARRRQALQQQRQ